MSERDSLAGMRNELAGLTHMVRAIADASGTTNGGNVTFTVNAGGVALWLSALCCVVMLVCTAAMALGLFWVAMDSRDRGHQMNALYQSVPGLRELVEKQMQVDAATREPPKEPQP